LGNFLAEVGFGVGLEFTENKRSDLLRGELLGLVAGLNLDESIAVFAGHDFVGEILGLFADLGEFTTDQALGGEDGVFGVGDGLALGGLADDALTGFGESDHGGSGACAFSVGNNHRLSAFHHGHTGVGGA